MSEGTATIRAGRRRVEVSRADKVLFPDDGITKGQLAEYYAGVADAMLPHLRDRPVNMQRFPNGIAEGGFYEKKVPEHFPGWIRRVRVETKEGSQEQVMCNDAAALVYLADQACIVPHVWLATADDLEHPDQMIFDLDPSDVDVRLVREAARALRNLLDEVGLPSFVKTTGSKGLHVQVPLDRSDRFDDVRRVARDLAAVLAGRHPDRFTTEQRKDKRRGRVYLDVMRNGYGQTAVPPYAVRPRPGAPVATPIAWDEVGRVTPDGFTIANVGRRLARREDPWRGMRRRRRSLDRPRRALDRLLRDG